MATTDFQWGRDPAGLPGRSVINTDGTNALLAGDVVTLDPAHPVSATQPSPGVKRSTTGDYPYGVCIDAIPLNGQGRVQTIAGTYAPVIASAAITAGLPIMCSTAGQVKPQTSGQPQLGQAMTAAAGANDIILATISIANNA